MKRRKRREGGREVGKEGGKRREGGGKRGVKEEGMEGREGRREERREGGKAKGVGTDMMQFVTMITYFVQSVRRGQTTVCLQLDLIWLSWKQERQVKSHFTQYPRCYTQCHAAIR